MSLAIFAIWIPYFPRADSLPLVVSLTALKATALLGRKRYPYATLAVCLVAGAALAVLTHRPFPVTPGVLVALYAVGRYGSRRMAFGAAIATILFGFIVAEVSASVPSYSIHNIRDLGWVVFAVLVGAWVRTQKEYVRGAEERADRAEREREEEARRKVAEERVRIARELHDVVGHALMSINVLSSVSTRLVDRDPQTGRDALRTISGISNSALQEIRSTVSLLREGSEPLKRPERGLEDLPGLIEQSRMSGLPVTLKQCDTHRDIPAIIGFTVYRIVQESLTNINRHAEGVTTVIVAVTCTDNDLDVTVVNDGAPARISEDGGTGIQGMRERVAATGGRLDAAALPGGGFRVHARLPLKEGSR